MDVHLRSTTVCALDAETGEAVTRRFRGNPWGEVAEWMSGFPGPSLAAYESGYLGFAPQRELSGLGVDCVVAAVSKVPRSAADFSSKNDRNDAARMAKAILSHDVTPVWVPSPRDRGAQGPRRRPRRRDCEARGGEAAAPGVPGPPWLRLRRHDAGRKPPEVLDVRLPQVARQGSARRRRRHPGACGAEERGRGGRRDARRPPRRVQGRRRGGPPLGGGRGAPVDQGVRVRARRRLRVRGRRLLEVPLRQAGDVLLRPRPEAEVERGLRAPRRDQRGRRRARQEVGSRGVLELRPGEPPTEADAQGQRRPARGEDAREEGFRAPAPAPRGRCSPGACPRRRRTPPPPPSS